MNPNEPTPNRSDDDPEHAGTMVDAAEIESLHSELAAERGRYERLAADFDSFRRRTARDAEQRAAAQKEAFIRDFLAIVDNLERALVGDAHPASDSLRRGIEMTLDQARGLLRRHGVEPDESVGALFDPHRHEAIGARCDPAQPDHIVLEFVQRGYRRGDEVIRPARVIINDHACMTSHGR